MSKAKEKYEPNAVELFRTSDTAVLSTISKSSQDYPFGSFTTFASNINRELIIYASDLAEHTKNICTDSRACATIFSLSTEDDKQASSRLSLIGDFSKIKESELETYANRFIKFLPKSASYAQMHGFNFYKLSIIKARWIGGFGEIAWLDTSNWTREVPKWGKNEKEMINHMNEDHQNVIASALNQKFAIQDEKSKILAMCIDGYYVNANNILYFIPFKVPCFSEKSIRAELVRQAHQNRPFEI
jgi:putative heme iron utilization protein